MRLKIIAGNLAVVLLLGLAAYVTISGDLRAQLASRLTSGLANDRTLFERSYRLSAKDFTELVQERAEMDQVKSVFAGLDESSRRNRAYDVAEATLAWLADPARGGRGAPDIVVVTDETGKAIARNGARNVMFGTSLLPAIPSLAHVLKSGESIHDVWVEAQEKKVLQTAVAAIRNDTGTILGALVVGYDLSNGVATREASLLGREVAFLVSDKVYSSSLSGGEVRALNGVLFNNLKPETASVLGGHSSASRQWEAALEGEDYVGITSRLPMSPSLPVAFAILGNRTEAMSPAGAVDVILIMMVLGAIMVIAYGFVVGNAIMRPIERIEDGVLAVINGRTDLRLETDSAELGGLAYRINQLLNVFTGTEEAAAEPDEDGDDMVRPESDWQGGDLGTTADAAGDAPTAAAHAGDEVVDDAEEAGRLAAVPEDQYTEEVYRAYVQAKQALGENVSNISKDRFATRLAGRASALAQKHGCRQVRFQVHTRDNQVVLRPVLIR